MTTRGPLWRVSITTTAEAEEAVTELLQDFFGEPALSYTDVETGVVTVMVYLSEEARPEKKRRRAAAVSRHGGTSALKHAVEKVKGFGLDVGTGAISVRKIRREDWAESWKRHFKPIEIGSALLIKPSWSKRAPKKGQAVIVLDPGLSFGTGQHPTTGFCLHELAVNFPAKGGNAKRSLLDIGTGSGILAIAAAKLGYAPVEAFDFDPEAVRIARENAQKNGVSLKVHIRREDVTKMTSHGNKKYDLVCANLISTLLTAERRRIVAVLKPKGTLVLAGILKNEFASVRNAYKGCGLRLVAGRTEGEWRSGAFRREN